MSTTTTTTQQYSGSQFPQTKAHEITEGEQKEITEPEVKYLMMTPADVDNDWMPVTGKSSGKTYYTIMVSKMEKYTPKFLNMLKSLKQTEYTHLAIGGFKFCFADSDTKIIKSEYFAKKQFSGGNKWAPKPTEYLAEVQTFVTPQTLNDFLMAPENQNQWKMLGEPKIDTDGAINFIIGRFTSK
jgi:hypothetical protein